MKIEFYTNEVGAMNYPPIPAKKMIPEWYKEIPELVIDKKYENDVKYQSQNGYTGTIYTIRGCMPLS